MEQNQLMLLTGEDKGHFVDVVQGSLSKLSYVWNLIDSEQSAAQLPLTPDSSIKSKHSIGFQSDTPHSFKFTDPDGAKRFAAWCEPK
jgi:hypothetical protein